MLENAKAFSGFAVDDLERAHQFYGGTLGLRTSEDNGLLTLHLAGGRDTLVYPKPDHITGDVHHPQLPGRGSRGGRRRARGARGAVRAVRGLRAGREGHLARPGRTADRMVQGSGREHPFRARERRDVAGGRSRRHARRRQERLRLRPRSGARPRRCRRSLGGPGAGGPTRSRVRESRGSLRARAPSRARGHAVAARSPCAG